MACQSYIKDNLQFIWKHMNLAVHQRQGWAAKCKTPRLVAVSKTKPASDVIEAYDCGQRHFGENYIQELVEKSADRAILENCPEICWHFIGHLQRNKVNKLVSIPNLYMVETVDSMKLSEALNAAWMKLQKEVQLKVLVQLNTSGEANKSGVEPSKASEVVSHIIDKCPGLQFCGLMTIGAYDYDVTLGPNPDFLKLIEAGQSICQAFSIDELSLELSMGMSSDFEHAVELGSTNIRVGSTIFGPRAKKH